MERELDRWQTFFTPPLHQSFLALKMDFCVKIIDFYSGPNKSNAIKESQNVILQHYTEDVLKFKVSYY